MTQTTLAPPAPRAAVRPKDVIFRAFATLLLAGFGLWLVLSFVNGPVQFLSAAVFGLSNGALYALIALGYTMVYGIIQLINFAHGDLFMIGTLVSAFIITTTFSQVVSGPTAWVVVALALVVTMAFCATANVTIEFVAYRRLRRAPKLAPLITAVGMSFVLQWVGLRWNGSGQRQWPIVLPRGYFDVLGVRIDYKFLIVIAVTVPLLLAMNWLVNSTKQGRAMRATAQDQDAARLMGIDVNRTISFTFALGGALAGAAGVMYQQTIGSTRYDLGFQLGLIAFTAAVLGGIGNLTGAVLGGVLIGLIQGLNEGAPLGLGQRWSQSVVFSILILLLVFRPQGLLGTSFGDRS